MKWLVKYREINKPRLYEETIEGTRSAAECNIYLRHCQNRLEGVPANRILKIESVSEAK